MIAYRVGQQYIFNVYLALMESKNTGNPVELYCNDNEYDRYNWAVEPEQTIEELMTAHALDLRSRYERLILLWSGGTDSHTMYNVLKKANIRIDEILIKASAHLAQYPDHHVDWMRANHWDPTTIITRYDQNDSYLRGIDCPDEDWVWKPKGDLLMFGMSTGADGVKHLIERNHSGKTWIAMAGFEKPRLVYRNGTWWSRQLDSPLRQTMGHTHLDHFFLNPLIHIKQSHMVKNAVKKHIANNKLPLWDNDWAEAKWDNTPDGYYGWATACGRHPELTGGASHLQKTKTGEYFSLDVSKESQHLDLVTNQDPTLQAYIKNNDQTAVNYVKGLFNLYSERGFVRWLNENNHVRKDNHLLQLNHVWSKCYDLGA